MEKNLKSYFKLFRSTFVLSAFTIGGGYVIASLMKKKFVDEYKWLSEEEVLDLIALAQSAPGPVAVNVSIMLGYRMAGIIGSIITTVGTVLPPLITIAIISHFYEIVKENSFIKALMKGMSVGVAAVIIDVIVKMGGDIIKTKNIIAISTMIAVFILSVVFNVNVAFLIVASGIFGGIYYKDKS